MVIMTTTPIPADISYYKNMLQVLEEVNSLNNRCGYLKVLRRNLTVIPFNLADQALRCCVVFVQVLKTPFIPSNVNGHPISKHRWFVVSLSILLIDIPKDFLLYLAGKAISITSLALGIFISPKIFDFGNKIQLLFAIKIEHLTNYIHHLVGNFHPSVVRIMERSYLSDLSSNLFISSWKETRKERMTIQIREQLKAHIGSFNSEFVSNSIASLPAEIKSKVKTETVLQDIDLLNMNELNTFYEAFAAQTMDCSELETAFNKYFLRDKRVQIWTKNFYSPISFTNLHFYL